MKCAIDDHGVGLNISFHRLTKASQHFLETGKKLAYLQLGWSVRVTVNSCLCEFISMFTFICNLQPAKYCILSWLKSHTPSFRTRMCEMSFTKQDPSPNVSYNKPGDIYHKYAQISRNVHNFLVSVAMLSELRKFVKLVQQVLKVSPTFALADHLCKLQDLSQ